MPVNRVCGKTLGGNSSLRYASGKSRGTAMREFAIVPLSPVLGAEVIGLDLKQKLDPGARGRLIEAFNDYHLLCFRDQSLSKQEQMEATLQFGELDVHVQSNRSSDIPLIHIVTNLDENDVPRQSIAAKGSVHWHSDKSYRRKPSLATFLYSVEVPPEGGETEFANMIAAYEALPAQRQAELSQMKVVHSWPDSVRRTNNREATDEEKTNWPPVAQPLARTHAESGRKSLFLGQHAAHIEGREGEGRLLIDELEAWSTQPRFVYAHRWRVGDLLMWDNRCLLHRAAPFDGDRHRRLMHRTVTQGPAPF
jgi:alpha-ketoglutarate-dependent taurine dioxygenase